MLETIWFLLWGVLWAVYFLLDGFDLGVGSLIPVLGKSERDKRVMINSMGPFWDGNEVWLLTAGGVTFAAFPTTYAVMFSSLYTPLMLILFMLILRGVTFEFRNKVDSAGWRALWTWMLTVTSLLTALLWGVAFANIFAGVPVEVITTEAGTIQAYLAQSVGEPYGLIMGLLILLKPYALLGGVLFVLLFLVHGALWLTVKAEGDLAQRAGKLAKVLWVPELIVAVAFLVASFFATDLWANHFTYYWTLVAPLLAVVGLVGTRVFMHLSRWWLAWAFSGLGIVGATLWGVAGLYPNLLPSSLDPAFSMTASATASTPLTLTLMLVIAGVFVPTVLAYQAWVYWILRHPVDDEMLADPHAY